MCDPMTMAVGTFIVGAAQSAVGYIQQSGMAAQQDAIYEQNRVNAISNHANQQNQANLRASQEMEAAAAEKFDTTLDARKARATHVVAAGEAGVSGLSIDGLLRDFSGREARYNDRVDQNLDWTLAQIETQKKGFGFDAVDRINSVQRGQKPSFIGLGLKIAGSGFDSVSQYRRDTA